MMAVSGVGGLSMASFRLGFLPVWLCLLVLGGCASNVIAPVESLGERPARDIHTVAKGETLYSIAWKNGVDYQTLAKINNIRAPFVIYPGQRLTLSSQARAPLAGKPAQKVKSGVIVPARYKNDAAHAKTNQEKVANKSAKAVNISWVWPASGSLVGKFSDSGNVNKGINLAGKRGDPVVAAADGVVVYSGPGIVGYGNLIIIKHDDTFLSAYAHNSRLLLGEGSRAKAGQKIAEIGSSGTHREQLHFEIRKNGVPVDPLGYLPRR
jgi:lipoprotein NlpD